MSIASRTLLGAQIRYRASNGTVRFLGFIHRLWIEPGNAKLEVLSVRTGRFFGRRTYYRADLLEVVRGRLFLQGDIEGNLSVDTVDKELLSIERSSVHAKNGTYLGIVRDAYFDPMGLMITQLDVVRSFLGYSFSRLLIGRQDIIDIKPGHVVVEDAVVEEFATAPVVLAQAPKLQPQRSAQCVSER